MKMYKVFALVYLDFKIFANAKGRLAEFLYFPVTTVILWGLFSKFVENMALEAGLVVFVVNIFWTFAYLAQSTVNMQMNEDSWSGSMKQMMITGLSEFEYLFARVISSTVVSFIVIAIMLGLAYYGFGLTMITTNFQDILMLSLVTLVGSIGLAILVAAIIFFAGIEYAFLGWTANQVFLLLSAPFYPATIYPPVMQPVVWAMPFTAIFENVRFMVTNGATDGALMNLSIITAFAYVLFSLPLYYFVFRYAKTTGRIVRMS